MTDNQQPIRWPGGHRAALSILVHVPGVGLDADAANQPNLVGIDYTATGLDRMLNAFGDLDVGATVAFTADAANGSPQLVRRAAELGHEVAASACSSTGSAADLIETITRAGEAPVHGLLEQLPGFQASEQEAPFGNDSGSAWRIAGTGGDLPATQRDPAATLIPISPYLIDMTWLSPSRPLPPSSLLEAWSLALAAHRADESFMTVVLHPHIAGRPGLLDTFTRFIDEVIATGDVWIARLEHVARAWHELSPENQR